MNRYSLFSTRDSIIISVTLLGLYACSPYVRSLLDTFKRDIKEFDIELESMNEDIKSDFSDISESNVEELNRFRKLFEIL